MINITPIFPSLIFHCEVSFDLSIIETILDLRKTHKSVSKSNIGGWQSEDVSSDPLMKNFINEINRQDALPKIRLTNSWININGPGSYNMPHTHPESDYSFVWYLKTSENCGNIVFQHPNDFNNDKFYRLAKKDISNEYNASQTYFFNPKDTMCYFFPSYLTHWVEENVSEENRISISGNVIFD
jgi:uncharacterized protein (TIGR02466 family)